MKVFYLDDIPTPYRLGVFKSLAKTLGDDFKVGFCAGEEPGRNWNLDFSGLNFTILTGFQFRPPMQLNPFSFKINFSVIKALKEFEPDVFIASGYIHPTVFLAVMYCRLKKIPYAVVSETNEHCSSTNGLKWRIKKALVAPIVKYMAFGLPCGSQAENYFKLLGVKPSIPYFYFPNTPDTKPIRKVCERLNNQDLANLYLRKYQIEKKEVAILFVGRLIDAKKPFELIQAYESLEQDLKEKTSLIIVGAGELENEVKKYAGQIENISHIPWLSEPNDVYELMCSADVFVLPSVHEPWGAVVNEAMAAGCCTVVSNRVGSAHDLIENGLSGFTYSSGDTESLSRILAVLIKDRKIREKMSSEAIKSAEMYSQEFAASNLFQGLSSVIEDE